MHGSLRVRIKNLPAKPGVYIFKNAEGRVIYVGKAKSLRNRVSSYFHADSGDSPKTRLLVREIMDMDYVLAGSELEALLLESNLIKRYKPHYNIRLKDDTGYPFLKLTNEPFPRLEFTRRVESDGARYFGPYSSAAGLRETLRFIRRVFPMRMCAEMKKNPCMYYHIEKCPGPCSGGISPEEYRKNIRAAALFLDGRAADVVVSLEKEMMQAAAEERFEKAAVLRDRLKALASVVSRQQNAVFADRQDRDAVGVAVDGRLACAVVMSVRRGLMTGHESFLLEVPDGETREAAMSAFLKLHYAHAGTVPREVIVSHAPPDSELINEMLTERAGRKAKLTHPKRGAKLNMATTALENASQKLADAAVKDKLDREKRRSMTLALTRRTGAEKTIVRILGFDISTIQGGNTVGSAVSFLEAAPEKDGYRKYIIKGSGRDDFSSMTEMAERHFRRVARGAEPAPDLVLVDGGKGQVSAAAKGIAASGFEPFPLVVGYAKKTGVSHIHGRKTLLILAEEEPSSWLVRRIIAEAHRFAISFHRKKRGEAMIES